MLRWSFDRSCFYNFVPLSFKTWSSMKKSRNIMIAEQLRDFVQTYSVRFNVLVLPIWKVPFHSDPTLVVKQFLRKSSKYWKSSVSRKISHPVIKSVIYLSFWCRNIKRSNGTYLYKKQRRRLPLVNYLNSISSWYTSLRMFIDVNAFVLISSWITHSKV